ncbi:membrane protein [Bryobacterales bacterium F-183]|nr:membrane protein [Bryobacterales bacterium F-183]
MSSSNNALKADLALVFISFVWGATFVVIKRALDDISPILFLAVRFLLAAALLALYFRRDWFPSRAHWKGGAIVGACLAIGYAFQTVGLAGTTPANAGFITGFYIPLVPLLMALVQRRLPSAAEGLGVLMATVGLVLLTLPAEGFSVRRGDILVLLGAISFAGQILFLAHYSKSIPYKVISFTQVAVSGVLASATFWWIDQPVKAVWGSSAVWIAVISTAVFATAVAFAVQSWAQAYATPTRTALIFALEPVFAWVTSYVMEGEILTPRAAVGALAIFAGIVLVELRGGK